ncbi:myelin-associated glycoprotein-like isoform X1 [Sebastes umbrosus]|uniref:myelin-associated glycoprotein-like isoform X1 n=1 Tax=Sebastes umbrosus TaxID=72105 RepID=UPI00189E0C6C|nr:myelin-associated glycoprotein-like isoform X1 [Sebastes umbrosus]
MFVLIWATLLFTVKGSNADPGSFPGGKIPCRKGSFCITLSEGEITAEAGLCVVIPCSFTTSYGFKPQHLVWYKCKPSKQRCGDSDIIFHSNKNNDEKVQSGFKGRVSLLRPDVSQRNCSIIINDVIESDSGSYRFRVNGLQFGSDTGFKANVSVKDLIQKPTVMTPPLTEGQQTTLTCTAPGFCSGSEPNITWTWRGAGEKASHITGNITALKTENLTAVTQRHSSTLMFNLSAEHHGTEVTCKVIFTNNITTEETVTLNVTYVKQVKITGNTSVEEGETLNLTCSVDSFPPSLITWTKLGLNRNLNNDTGPATLVIPNVTAEHSGPYICTAKHLENIRMEEVNITVKFFPRILSSSACEVQSEVLTCVCISEGFPLPTIKWPLLKNHAEYAVITSTTVSNHTINVTVSVKDRNYTTVECVSSNDIGEAKETLSITRKEIKQEDLLKNFLLTFKLPQVIIAFFIGILLSATIFCLARKCRRNKQKSSGNVAETLEMGTIQAVPLIDAGQSVGNDGTHEGGAEAAGQSVPDGDVEPREVEYSDIDFSLLKRKSPTGAEDTLETPETEYAEIQKKETKERQDNGEEDGEMLEGNEEEEEEEKVMIEEDKESKQCMSAEEEGGEDVAVYSNVKEIMGDV